MAKAQIKVHSIIFICYNGSMKKVVVLGCPGAGKSYFSKRLTKLINIPLYHLDMIWHKPDKTYLSDEEFDIRHRELLEKDSWIIDGNYFRTLDERLKYADCVFLFDVDTDICVKGALSRIGTKRDDLPWFEDKVDDEFIQYIKDFKKDYFPRILKSLENYHSEIIVFKNRTEADEYLDNLASKYNKK